jgi:hypothetical protein
MTKACTDIEESKKLVELGLDKSTADMGWSYSRNPYQARNRMYLGTLSTDADIPAWSLSALSEIIPQTIEKEYTINIVQGYQNKWFISYVSVKTNDYLDYFMATGETLLDTMFDLVCKLLEKKKI